MSNHRAHIIAEAGVNHNGSVEDAKKLIKIASEAGADSVKFQIINPWGLYLPGEYKYGHYNIKDVIKNRFSTVLSDEEYSDLNKYAKSLDIIFSGSVFDIEGLKLLSSFKPPYIKVASSDLTNIRLLRQIADTGQKMILSTGMSTLKEIEKSLNELKKVNYDNIVLMHCVSIYPCPTDKSNVSMVKTFKENFGYEIGFSDHTRTNESAVAAYCMGARWFEKHFTYDNTLEGFDHKHAQNEIEFKNYIAAIRDIEISLSNQRDKIDEKEAYTAVRARRSLYAAHNIKAGETIKDSDVLCVRPSNKLIPNEIDLLVGQVAKNDIAQYAPFSLEDIANA